MKSILFGAILVGSFMVLDFFGTFHVDTALTNRLLASESQDVKASQKDSDSQKKSLKRKRRMPRKASEYAKMCESELGVPPKINLDECVEIPLYMDGVRKHGVIPSEEADNPNLQGKDFTSSGSVVQRYQGRTVDGKPLPDVIWISFGRNEDWDGEPSNFVGSVQMIGYNKKSGATAFFESKFQNLDRWVSQDKGTLRMRGQLPWIDNPKEFNQAYVPAPMQCVSCHQADPFITNPFIKAAKIPGTDETVVPILDGDSPYYVIGGEDWDMRTIHIEGNACFECHRVGMNTVDLFASAGWELSEHMPPHDPGSLAQDYRELVAAWKKGPENVEGAEWIIPPARGNDRQVVGADYPYKSGGNEAEASPLGFFGDVLSSLFGEDSTQPDGDQALWDAAKTGNIDEIKAYLANGTQVNAKNEMGLTPLMMAAFTGQTETMKFLIKKGANVNFKDSRKGTALHGASFFGQTKAVRILVENGADVNARNEDGETSWELAARPWSEEINAAFQFVTGILEIKVDPEKAKAGRPKVAAYFRHQKATSQPQQSREVEQLLKQLRDPEVRQAFEDWIQKYGVSEDTLEKLRSMAKGDK